MKTVALSLGGGGARGLAHIAMLEAFDELGIKPVAISGTSMGALFGAAYASGLSAAEIREFTLTTLADRRGTRNKLLAARTGKFADLFSKLGNPVLIDGTAFCEAFLPGTVVRDFEQCRIPLTVVATDFHARREQAFTMGPLRQALAASMAIPGAIRPVRIGSQVFIDGATTNPLPIDHIAGKADIMVGVDVNGMPSTASEADLAGTWDAMFGALQIMQTAIVDAKVAHYRPDILIRPNVGGFRALDFSQASVIFRLTQPAKDDLKRQLAALLD